MSIATIDGLKPQSLMRQIDLGNPRLIPMIRMLQNRIRAEASAWQPQKEMCCEQLSFRTEKGSPFDCLVISPLQALHSQSACLYLHGGGMVFPLQASSLRIAETYAEALGISVWVPDYHLPPDAVFPVPLEEGAEVWRRMTARHPGPVLLYGESVGGALAASLAQYLRDRGERQAALQMLIYPALDCDTQAYPSADRDAVAVWTLRNNRYMWSQYLNGRMDVPYGVPARGTAAGLPPAYIEAEENDILRDEALAYADMLRTSGVRADAVCLTGTWHGFDTETGHPFVRQILQNRINYMRKALEEEYAK